MMRRFACVLLMAACGSTSGDDGVDPPLGELSAIERCVLGGSSLAEAWSVGNRRGPITSIVADSLIVVGSADGSVKQWTPDGDDPSYGVPFSTQGPEVAALALTSEGTIVSAAKPGAITEWRLSDATQTTTMTIADTSLSTVSVRADNAQIVVGTSAGEVFAIDRATSERVQLSSYLWSAHAVRHDGSVLLTAGHDYGTPRVEQRDAASPVAIVDAWSDISRTGHIRGLDSKDGVIVAAGDGLVAVLAAGQLQAGPLAISELTAHQAIGVVMLPGGELFATAGSEGTLRLWKTADASLVATLPIAPAAGLARNRDGSQLYTAGPDGRVHGFGCR